MTQYHCPLDKQKFQLDMFDDVLQVLLLKYPKLRVSKWCKRLPEQVRGDVDLLIEMKISDQWVVVAHLEFLNWWPCSVGDGSRLRDYKQNLDKAAGAGLLIVHPEYFSVLILCGGNRDRMYLYPEENGWTMFRHPEPVGPVPTRSQKKWAGNTMKRILKKMMSIVTRTLCKLEDSGQDFDMPDDPATVIEDMLLMFRRLSGS